MCSSPRCNSRWSGRALLLTQRDQRIDPHGPARGDDGREQGDGDEHAGGAEPGERVAGRDAEQQRRDEARRERRRRARRRRDRRRSGASSGPARREERPAASRRAPRGCRSRACAARRHTSSRRRCRRPRAAGRRRRSFRAGSARSACTRIDCEPSITSCIRRTSDQIFAGFIATRCVRSPAAIARRAGGGRRAHHQHHVVLDDLRVRPVDGHRRRLVEIRLPHVGHDAHDLPPDAFDRTRRAAARHAARARGAARGGPADRRPGNSGARSSD